MGKYTATLRGVKALFFGIMLLFFTACSYYTIKSSQVQESISTGDIQGAYKLLSTKENKWEKGRNKLLYYLDRATVAWMLNKNTESIEYFQKADYFIEDQQKNYGNVALSLFINDKSREYSGEDYEKILLSYYQIINFLQTGNYENALVQTRRLQLALQKLDDKYKDKKPGKSRHYQRDAFAYVLMGLVYEASGETNNAFIAYKNAANIYEEDYKEFFGMGVPQQLKEDLLRTANDMGFNADLEFFEKKFGMQFDPKKHRKGNFIFFWNNGLVPVKQQVSINFAIVRSDQSGWALFVNTDLGLSFPVYVGENNTKSGSAFSQVEFVRAAFPKYFERKPVFTSGNLVYNGTQIPFQPLEDVNDIAFKVLNDRFLEEMGKTLLRLATKKAAEYTTRQENQDLGAALGLINAITEQADTRSWRTLPHTIYYTRTQLPEGKQTVQLSAANGQTSQQFSFTFDIKPGKSYFHAFQTMQSMPANGNIYR